MTQATAPLTAADLAATRRPLAEAVTLPAAAYVSESVFALEQRGIFARSWLCAGREADIPKAGDWFLREIAGESVVVTRGADGAIHAWHNVCRHRGSRLLEEARGSGLKRVLCPYHSWSYELDGRLQQAPGMADDPRCRDLRLAPVRVAARDGFLYLNLDSDAVALETALADLPDFSRFRMGDLVCGRRIEYDVAANWKLLCENYSECYHCPNAHPQLHRISDLFARADRVNRSGQCFNGGPMLMREGVQTMSMSGRSNLPQIPGLPADDHRHVYYYVIYPNFLLSPHPDYVLTHTAWPLAPDRTRVICEWLFTAEAVAQPGFDPSDVIDFWDVTNRQDWKLCERTQLGAGSRGFKPGPYTPVEDCVHVFDSWYAGRMATLV
ncbi:MAG: aromatic ring-hydroxylating dioxygenase subunit alpha [Gammaproteobacteria bacterium]|nr:aromatic ring-hydroxylating dioxygenase subunit alpha [Gammaproteobacteria bacterium]